MSIKLFVNAMIKVLSGILLTGIFIFLPAGDFSYKNGWLLMAILFIPMVFAGVILMLKNPNLLRKRLDAKEEEKEQKILVFIAGIMFIAGFIISGLGYRLKWYTLPDGIVYPSAVIFLITYALYGEVLRENKYLSRAVKVQEGQMVIDKGLYGIVRHPMYSVTLILFLTIPLVLGSLYAFMIFLIYPIIIVRRIRKEEKLLEEELSGYRAYKEKVRYRLIPFVW